MPLFGGDSLPPVVTITPSGSMSSQSVAVTIDWCDDHALAQGTRQISLNRHSITSSFTYTTTTKTGCPAHATSTGTISLPSGWKQDTLLASITDLNNHLGADTVTYTYPYTAPPVAARYGVLLTPKGDTNVVTPSGLFGDAFVLQNSGNQTVTYTLTTTCTGTAFSGGCSLYPSSSIALGGGRDTIVIVSFTSGANGTSGSMKVTGVQTTPNNPSVKDSGSVTVRTFTATPAAPAVTVSTVNPGTAIERSACVTIAAGSAGHAECGDLQLVHELPTVRTMNKSRTPVLLYNSQFAHPYPIVAATVRFGDSTATPDTVLASLNVGGTVVATGKWLGSYFGAGLTRRIAVAFDAITDSTGVYPYTLTVTNKYVTAGQSLSGTATGSLVIVNRARSAFGAGWWLAGLERLYVLSDTTQRLWVGGDGSARVYTKLHPGDTVWSAASLDRPDTLKYVRGTQTYVQYLPHGVQVQYNSTGQHVATVNRLGHLTKFHYTAAGLLDSIRIPVPSTSSATLAYVFAYDGTQHLHAVTAPGVGSSRVTTVTVAAGRDTMMTDPDGSTVRFGYASTASDTNRLVRRTNRLGFATTYTYDVEKRLAADSIALGGSSPGIVTRMRWPDSLALAASPKAVSTDSAYLRIDGPRTDVTDWTYFLLDQYGQPTRIQDALGNVTLIGRADARWPLLPTRVQSANGRVLLATYSVRGNDSTVSDSNVYRDGRTATTTYLFDPTWDYLAKSISPTGIVDTLAYDASTGNRLFEQLSTSSTRRVTYSYWSSTGLLASISPPLATRADSVYYDARLGDDSATVSARGFRSYSYVDAVGKTVHTRVPFDSAGVKFTDDSVVFDVMDRPTTELRYAAALTDTARATFFTTTYLPIPAETLSVVRQFDAEGEDTSLARSARPDIDSIGQVRTKWRYDQAGRVLREIASDGFADVDVRDAAGNVTTDTTRRGHVITMTYDALNRLTQRALPAVYEPNNWNDTDTVLPEYTTGYYIINDVQTYAYDAVGHMTGAVNRNALVSRTYNLDGSIATDTLRIRNYVLSDSSQHVYGLTYAYDLDGRRTSLTHPMVIAPIVGGVRKTLQTYGYDGATGALDTVTDVLGNVFRLSYDARQRLDTLRAPGSVLEYWTYDADDNVIGRVDSAGAHVGQPGGFLFPTLHRDRLARDAQGRIISGSAWSVPLDSSGATDTVTVRARYSGLGALIDGGALGSTKKLEEYEDFYIPDALGNTQWSWSRTIHLGVVSDSAYAFWWQYFAGTGRLNGYIAVSSGLGSHVPKDADINYAFDSSGNVTRHAAVRGTILPDNFTVNQSLAFYDAEQRLSAISTRTCWVDSNGQCNYQSSIPEADLSYFEEYRYDALGRRVLVRTRSDSTCVPAKESCRSSITRFVYDGDQVLYEISMPGADSVTAAQLERDTSTIFSPTNSFGRVLYTHGLGIDKPLDIIRVAYDSIWPGAVMVVPHENWHGVYDFGSFVDGRAKQCADTTYPGSDPSTCVNIRWPAPQSGIYFEDQYHDVFAPPAWFGSLSVNRRDASGQIFLRNRYYNPAAGRFTQEDPLGVAGGLNLYGYANGDPVNYSDPFGLCPQCAPALALAGAGAADEVVPIEGQIIGTGMILAGLSWAAYLTFKDVIGSTGGPTAGRRATLEERKASRDRNRARNNGELRCVHCGTELTEEPGHPNSAETDHLQPRSPRGGGPRGNNEPDNLDESCRTCNRQKSNKRPEDFRPRENP